IVCRQHPLTIARPRPRRTNSSISSQPDASTVGCHSTVEASGWELMLEFVRLGLGLAIVNGCCRLPTGLVARSIPELPAIQYYIFHLERALPKPAQDLKRSLLASADAWKART